MQYMGGAMGQPSPTNYDDNSNTNMLINNDNNAQLEDNFSQLSFNQKGSSKHDSQQSNKQQFIIGQIEDQQHSMGNHRTYQTNPNTSANYNEMGDMAASMQQVPMGQARGKQNQINTG